MITPHQLYQQDIEQGAIIADEQQLSVVADLTRLQQTLIQQRQTKASLIHRLRRIFWLKSKSPITGLYLWGGVGIGKTYMMDIFYQSLPFDNKRRIHFHPFMAQVHTDLQALQGQENPLEQVAMRMAQQAQVLCFDEFIVEDIGDAMLLAGLLVALFKAGVCVIATSNTEPDQLYRNGLQRGRFIPAIELIKQHMTVKHLAIQVDYRRRCIEDKGVYFTPNNKISYQQLEDYFAHFSLHETVHYDSITIAHRLIITIKHTHGIAWFDYAVLCHAPRSQLDYLELAQQYSVIILSGIPLLSKDDPSVSYFIKLIDVLYDHHVKLIICADAGIDELYRQGQQLVEFQRTKSRLIEMQTQSYWHHVHNIA